MIDVSELLFDPDFVESFTVMRRTGTYLGNGLYDIRTEPQEVEMLGAIQASSPGNLTALPEGERESRYINVWSNAHIVMSDGLSNAISDEVLYKSELYRVVQLADRADNGYYKAIAQYVPHVGAEPYQR